MSKLFTADFETSTKEWYDIDGYVRVWAWAVCEIGNPDNKKIGTDISEFIKFCSKKDNYKIYFHNLKFDGEYILYYLLTNGYTYVNDKKDRKDKTFTILLSDTGQFYSMEIYFKCENKKHINKVSIYDSLKILNFSVEVIANKFDLPIKKLKLDYNKYRKIGHKLTIEEKNYIINDVEIMARALDIMFNEGLDKMTMASNAINDFKELIPSFKNYFPELSFDVDKVCRQSYKGGWTYLNPKYKNKQVKEGLVIDANSMHPAQMYSKYLPFGEPLYFDGKYKDDICYPLYIQVLTCSFKLKKNKLPCIQIKNTPGFIDTEYIEDTHNELVTLALTNVDLKLFFMQYEITSDISWGGGYKFKQVKGLFCKYIDKWTSKKQQAKREKNNALYNIAKLMMNSLYGKFGLNPVVRSKYPYLKNDESVGYSVNPKEIRPSIYVPVASFITAYSRYNIITNSQAIRDYTIEKYGIDYYIYSDTDSIHCLKLSEEELSKVVKLDDYELGAYKIESTFVKGKYIKSKCYIELGEDGKLNTTIAGLPKQLGKYINFSNFKIGFSVLAEEKDKEHKLRFKHVKGGVLLYDTDFTIKI